MGNDLSFEEQVTALRSIDIERPGVLHEWKFNKIVFEKGFCILIADVAEEIPRLSMEYSVSIILNPANYNIRLNEIIAKMNDAQKELFSSEEKVLKELQKVHADYKKESEMFGSYDFKATVIKYERKTKTNQVKFAINTATAEYFLKSYGNCFRSAMILENI